MTLKGLIFDFDGLILDTEMPKFQAWTEIFEDFGCNLVLEEYAKSVGSSNQEFNPLTVLASLAIKSFDSRLVLERYQQRELELLAKECVLSGIQDLIIEAKNANKLLAIASSSDRPWVVNHLTRLGLIQYFDAVITENEVQKVKPHPDLFSLALSSLGLDSKEALALEDSPNGMIAAKAARLFVIGVPNPITSRLDLSNADHIYPSLKDVHLKDLENIFSEKGNNNE